MLVFAAGALAFIANLAVLRPAETPPSVVVAAADLLPGAVLHPSIHLAVAPVSTDETVLATLIPAASLESLDGRVVGRRVSAGSFLTGDVLLPVGSTGALRLMSVPVDRDRAAGGNLVVGDRVDVIAVEDGRARFVVAAAEVVALPDERGGALSGSGRYFVVVAVDADAALALSEALDVATVQVVRSTGAPVPERVEASDAG